MVKKFSKCEKNIHKNASLIIQKKKVCVTNPKRKYAPQFISLLHNNASPPSNDPHKTTIMKYE